MKPHANPHIELFYDTITGTVSYVVYDANGGRAAILDPVLDYNPRSGPLEPHAPEKSSSSSAIMPSAWTGFSKSMHMPITCRLRII